MSSIEYQLSTLSIPGAGWGPLKLAVAWMSLGSINNQLASPAGYDGLSVVPTHRIHGDINTGKLTEQERALAKSGGQTFRDEVRWIESWRHPNRGLAISTRMVFPHKDQSLYSLFILQSQRAPRLFPVAVQTFDDARTAHIASLQEVNVISSPEAYISSGAGSTAEFVEFNKYRNVQVCLDPTYQLYRPSTAGESHPFPNPEQFIRMVMPVTGMIHLSLGRTDLGYRRESLAQFMDLYKGTLHTEIHKRLTNLRISMDVLTQPPPVVLQIPYTAVAAVLEKRSVNIGDLRKVHEVVLRRIKTIFGDTK